MDEVLARLRSRAPFGASEVRLAGPLEAVWDRAVADLAACVVDGVLHEGGVYRGTWLESTGTISAEVLGRFLPDVATATFRLFSRGARADGLLPYKVTPAGPAYRQIQIVTPLARSVWHHYGLTGDRTLLRELYDAMAGNDAWLARHRDTRGTGCVEAFCTFDTGHDASPRFWHLPDTTHHEDPARFDPGNPLLPLLAPDLTANVACQRAYLGVIAAELGEDPTAWQEKAAASTAALWRHCYDEVDGFFYDVDRSGQWVRVQSDVLLRVLACEIGDAAFVESCLRRYLLNTRKFFAHHPFTSIALDDPRFSQDFSRNSWAGPTNFLSLIRAPHAFERHGHHTELTWAMRPVLDAVGRMDRFPQTLNPWSGEPGFTEQYSPAILWTLDAVERLAGILPRPDGQVWCTTALAEPVGYARSIDGIMYELLCDGRGEAVLVRDGREHARFPQGWRLVLDRAGAVRGVLGVVDHPVTGTLTTPAFATTLTVAGNEARSLDGGGAVVARTAVPLVRPTS